VGTGSLAILSALSEEEVKHVINSNTPRLPEYGLTPASLLAQVKSAQKRGYAVREMPSLAGVRSIGHAMHNQSGVAFAGIVGIAISSRMNEKRVNELATL
jgi:DNA-binding IclR family transcriptional regulator